jgi:hypothetical protein
MFTQGHSVEAQLWILPLKGDGKPFQYTNAPARMQEANGLFSPDGRWVAYQSNDTGRPEVFVAPFPWTGVKWQVSNGGGADVRWSADGKKLYYFDFSGIVEAEVNGSGQSFAVGNSKLLFRLPVRGLSREYAPTRDGKRFIAITPAEGSSQSLILVQNWTAALKKR